mgnify:FL=1
MKTQKKLNLRAWMFIKVLPAIVLVMYYWMITRYDFQINFIAIQNIVFGFFGVFLYFLIFGKNNRDLEDEFAKHNIMRVNSFCLKISYLLFIVIALINATLELSTVVLGYFAVGSILILSIIRAIAFYILDTRMV